MTLLAIFLALIFLYSLVSARLERTVLTAPIVFTAAGMVVFQFLPSLPNREAGMEIFLRLAEVGLVLLLFTDASRTELAVLKRIRNLPVRLLSAGMLLTILLGALGALAVFPQLTIWEAGILAAILAPTDAGPWTNHREQSARADADPPGAQRGSRPERRLVRAVPAFFHRAWRAPAPKGTARAWCVSSWSNWVTARWSASASAWSAAGFWAGRGAAEWMAESLQQLGRRRVAAALPAGRGGGGRQHVHRRVCRRAGGAGGLPGRRQTQRRIHRGMGPIAESLGVFSLRHAGGAGLAAINPGELAVCGL